MLQWTDAGEVTLDGSAKAHFGPLPAIPGLYRITLVGAGLDRPTIYIGETDNLRRRLSVNYRNPGARQQTSLRINAMLRSHLADGGAAQLAVALHGKLEMDDKPATLDFGRKAARLLAESAALVTAQLDDASDIANLG